MRIGLAQKICFLLHVGVGLKEEIIEHLVRESWAWQLVVGFDSRRLLLLRVVKGTDALIFEQYIDWAHLEVSLRAKFQL